jgi:hypothetical protein
MTLFIKASCEGHFNLTSLERLVTVVVDKMNITLSLLNKRPTASSRELKNDFVLEIKNI